MRDQVADGENVCGHDFPSKNMKRKQQRTSRHSATNLPEKMLTNAEMNSVGTVARQSHTTVWVATQPLQFGADHATLDRVLVRHLDKELFRNGERARRLALFGTIYCRGVPRHPHITSRCRRALRSFVRDEPGFSKDPLPPQALVIWSSDLLMRHSLLDKLAGLALVMSYDLPTRQSETLKISSRDVIALKRGDSSQCQSSFRRAWLQATRQQHNPRKNGQFDDTVVSGLLGFQRDDHQCWRAFGAPSRRSSERSQRLGGRLCGVSHSGLARAGTFISFAHVMHPTLLCSEGVKSSQDSDRRDDARWRMLSGRAVNGNIFF